MEEHFPSSADPATATQIQHGIKGYPHRTYPHQASTFQNFKLNMVQIHSHPVFSKNTLCTKDLFTLHSLTKHMRPTACPSLYRGALLDVVPVGFVVVADLW